MAGPQISLESTTAGMALAFGQAGARLSDVRGGMQTLSARLSDLAAVLAGQRQNALILDQVQSALTPLSAAVANARSVALPQRFSKAVFAARSAVAEIRSRTRELDSVASLTLVTARSLDLSGFEDYVSSLRALGATMRDDSIRLDTAVGALHDRRGSAERLFAEAEQSLDAVGGVLATLARERDDNDIVLTTTLSNIASEAARLPQTVATETDCLVRAMQFADTVAQRLDHIGQILRADTPAAAALAAAQIRALAADTRQTMRDVTAALDRVGAAAGEASQVLSHDSTTDAAPVTRSLELGRKVLSHLADGAARALSAIGDAAEESGPLRALAEEATLRFASVVRTTEAVHLAAINAALLARYDDGREKAIKVLSVEVQQQASACERASAACRLAVSALCLPEDIDAFDAVSRAAEVFSASVSRTSIAVDDAAEALGDLGRLRAATADSLERLSDGILVAREAAGRILAETDALVSKIAGLPARVPPGTGPLDEFMALYTMEAERAVHRRLLGLPEPVPAPAAPLADDPLEAILF